MKMSYTKSGKTDGTEKKGVLVAHFGATAEIQDLDGNNIRCNIRKNLEPIVTGDNILWQSGEDKTGIIVACLPRKSLLSRPEKNNKIKLIAANIDAVIVVTAPATFSEYLIDRYLIAAENLGLPAVILLNKVDLLDELTRVNLQEKLSVYEKIGYPILYSSIKTENSLKDISAFLQEKTCVFVGTSGVGKSSLISAFLPNECIQIGETSLAGLGKHTTTSTRLYTLINHGAIIDSPGIREFGLWRMSPSEVAAGFVEFKNYLGYCKFRNCNHFKESGCALIAAVEKNEISQVRLESYRKIIKELA